MRLNHSAISIALFIAAGLFLALGTPVETAAASDCPCIRGDGGICIPDRACEARQRQLHDRLMQGLREHPDDAAPQNGSMHYQHSYSWGRPSTAAPPPTTAPAPTAAPVRRENMQRENTQMEYRRAPTSASAPPPPIAPRTGADVARPTAEPSIAPEIAARARVWHPTAGSDTAAIQPGQAAGGGRLRILETGYSHLSELGKEEAGYGLYSYAILPSGSGRAASFLSHLFKEIPSIGDTGARRSQLNVFYVPLKKDRESDFAALLEASGTNPDKMGAEYSKSLYDYRIARALLDHVCNPPADSIRALCEGDLSRGPYIFTYASPASSMDSVPPPFLFVDLSNVHEQAFGELIAAFRSQVKRDDISDQARIRTLRLTILEIALTAADWVNPVEKAIAEIVHAPSAEK